MKKDIHKLERFKAVLDQKLAQLEEEGIDFKRLIKENQMGRFFEFQKVETKSGAAFRSLVESMIRDYKDKRKGVLKELKEEKKKKIYL